jgi:poly(A) polymerase/tRNA nucleotidyltransferase (CCA-adding enzyme)
MKQFPTPHFLRPVAKRFVEHGYSCYLVGGAVRNLLQGTEPEDFDLATDAPPDEVRKLFKRVIPTGIEHGTVTVLFRSRTFEVTTFRVEGKYSDSRHPDEVGFTPSIEEDLKRRDFTVNGMAVDLGSDAFLDPHDGYGDLQRGLIRAIGEPEERFREDGLRIMRAVRFATQLQFEIEPQTFGGIRNSLDTIEDVSAERIRDELVKILESKKPSFGIRTLHESGILARIIPELDRCSDIPQGSPTAPDVLTHAALSCDGAPAARLDLRLAALLHDIGKAPSFTTDAEGGYSFHGHEQESARLTESILRRLRFPNATVSHVSHLVRHHMFNYRPDWSDAAVRRFIARVGEKSVPDLLKLREADLYGKHGEHRSDRNLDDLERRVAAVLEAQQALSIRDLALNGNQLHEEAGIPKSRVMGEVLEFLLERVLEDPALNEKQKLLELARSYYREHRGAR